MWYEERIVAMEEYFCETNEDAVPKGIKQFKLNSAQDQETIRKPAQEHAASQTNYPGPVEIANKMRQNSTPGNPVGRKAAEIIYRQLCLLSRSFAPPVQAAG
ncbi:hypothetical protein VTL71DRAFT_3549, partial [Oculimacula yallundae]